MNKPFHFYTQLHLTKLLGIKAKNPVEILEGLKRFLLLLSIIILTGFYNSITICLQNLQTILPTG